MDALTLPGKKCTAHDLDSIRIIVDAAPSLAVILAGVFAEAGRRLTLMRMEDQTRNMLLGMIRCLSGSEVYFSLPAETAAKDRALFDPTDGVQSLADTGAPLLDQEWINRRNRDLSIRSHRGLEAIETEVAPRHAEDLILSYSLSQYGQANVTREEWYDRTGTPHDALLLDLSCLDEERGIAFGEFIWLDWKKLLRFTGHRGSGIPTIERLPQ